MTEIQPTAIESANKFLAEHVELHRFKEIRGQLERASSALASVSDDAVCGLAQRLLRCTYDAFFMGQVCSWKVFHLVRAFASSLETKNAVSLEPISKSLASVDPL
jgi:hypothetical protein